MKNRNPKPPYVQNKDLIEEISIQSIDKSVDLLNKLGDKTIILWIFFVTSTVYVYVPVFQISQIDILLTVPQRLPFIGVDLNFYAFASLIPLAYLILYLYFITRINNFLSRYDLVVDNIESQITSNRQKRTFLDRIETNIFIDSLTSYYMNRTNFRLFCLLLVVFTTIIIPVLLSSLYLMKFLPLQDIFTTWSHRFVFVSISAIAFFNCFRVAGLSLDRHRYHSIRAVVLSVVSVGIVSFALIVCRWPDEPLVGSSDYEKTKTGINIFGINLSAFPDRLNISNVTVVGDKLYQDKIAEAQIGGIWRYVPTRDLSNRSFNGAVFASSDLRGFRFQNSILRKSDFTRSLIELVDFSGADLSGSNFVFSTANRSSFSNSILNGASMAQASFISSSFSSVEAIGVEFSGSNLQGTNISGNIYFSFFVGTNLFGSRIYAQNMIGNSFDHADLSFARISPTQAFGSTFEGTRLDHVNWGIIDFRPVRKPGAIRRALEDPDEEAIPLVVDDVKTIAARGRVTYSGINKENFFEEKLKNMTEALEKGNWRPAPSVIAGVQEAEVTQRSMADVSGTIDLNYITNGPKLEAFIERLCTHSAADQNMLSAVNPSGVDFYGNANAVMFDFDVDIVRDRILQRNKEGICKGFSGLDQISVIRFKIMKNYEGL